MVLILFFIGTCIGSFTGALVWRIHNKKNWLTGRSCCESCSHKLAVIDLIPIISWVSLKGKCRYCRKPIGCSVLVLELLCGVIFALSYMFWPYGTVGLGLLLFVTWLTVISVGFILAYFDAKYMILPNGILLLFFVTVIGFFVLRLFVDRSTDVLQALLAAASTFTLFYLLWRVSHGKWIGGGDIKLLPVLCILCGSFLNVFIMLFLASLAGSIYGVVFASGMNKKSINHSKQIPFGPFLLAGTFLAILLEPLLTRYLLYS